MMNVKGILKHVTLITAIFLISIFTNVKDVHAVDAVNVISWNAGTLDVNVTNTYVPFRPYGTYTLWSTSGRTITGSTASGWDVYGNLSNQLAHIQVYQDQSVDLLNSIYTRQGSIYNNVLTPLYTNVTYYLPVMSSALQTIGTSTDQIKTNVALMKTSLSNIESDVQDIVNALNATPYMDVNITADEKDTVSTGIATMLGLVPLDSDNKPYVLDLQSLIDDWANGLIRQTVRRKTTGYFDLYN